MENQERIELLQEAQVLIEEAKGLIEEAMEGTEGQEYYEAYGRCGIDQALGNGNPYDSSIDKLIEELEN